MIYTVTLNPSIDYSVYPECFRTGEILRSQYEKYTFGGKGLNVSAILTRLGVENCALGFCGGFSGREIERLARRAGILCDFCEIFETSRINVKIISEEESAINALGPMIRLSEEEKLLEKLSGLSGDDTVIISGKSPQSESGRLLENVIEAASKSRLIADMEGKDLSLALSEKPFLVKPNKEELSAFFGKESMSGDEVVVYARKLKELGAQNVFVSLGKDGALLVAEDGQVYRAKAPEVKAVSTVGAGDSCLAGFVAGYDRGYEFALALAMAAGAATAQSPYLAEAEEIMQIFSQM